MGLFIFLVFFGPSPQPRSPEGQGASLLGISRELPSERHKPLSETKLGVGLHWGMLQCCEYTFLQGPRALPKEKSSPFKKPGPEPKTEALLAQLPCPKAVTMLGVPM